MPRVATKRKGLTSSSTLEDSFSVFLAELRPELPAYAFKNAEEVIEMLRHYLNSCNETNDDNFCKQSQPAALINYIDRFLRYCVMRELLLSFEQQQFVFFVTYDFCEWLYKNKLLKEDAFAAFQRVKDNHVKIWELACNAAHELASTRHKRVATTATKQVIEFGRHDIARIEGDQMWLTIWSLPTLPKDCNIGPIIIPKQIAASLQVGWMITCELAKSKSGWQFVEVGNIYPSLPFE